MTVLVMRFDFDIKFTVIKVICTDTVFGTRSFGILSIPLGQLLHLRTSSCLVLHYSMFVEITLKRFIIRMSYF